MKTRTINLPFAEVVRRLRNSFVAIERIPEGDYEIVVTVTREGMMFTFGDPPGAPLPEIPKGPIGGPPPAITLSSEEKAGV